jgi:hypothetical protein
MPPEIHAMDCKKDTDRRWILVDRPPWPDVLRAHLPGVAVAGGVLLAARLYPFREHPVITCQFRKWTGHPCPGCGYTRAFQSIARGRGADAARDAPASLLLFGGVVLVLAWNLVALALRRRLRPGPRLVPGPRAWRTLGVIGALVLAANWIWRIANGLQ